MKMTPKWFARVWSAIGLTAVMWSTLTIVEFVVAIVMSSASAALIAAAGVIAPIGIAGVARIVYDGATITRDTAEEEHPDD